MVWASLLTKIPKPGSTNYSVVCVPLSRGAGRGESGMCWGHNTVYEDYGLIDSPRPLASNWIPPTRGGAFGIQFDTRPKGWPSDGDGVSAGALQRRLCIHCLKLLENNGPPQVKKTMGFKQLLCHAILKVKLDNYTTNETLLQYLQPKVLAKPNYYRVTKIS